MNLAWINFGYDLSQFDEARFTQNLDDIASSGGNCVRWWIHVNGTDTPTYDDRGLPQAMRPEDVTALKRALDLAADHGVGLVLCLWSFDMLTKGTGVDAARNTRLLEDESVLAAYLERTLAPLAKRMGNHPALVAWEVFNEPEGMVEGVGWTPYRTSMAAVQRFVNRVAGTLHRAVPGVMVTNGSASFQFQSDVCGTNQYRDDRLIAAGGDPEGTLDFYGVHYYPEHHGEELSPFHHPVAHWKLDKPVVIGEFPSKGIVDVGTGFRPRTTLTTTQAYQWAYDQGYAGALSWTLSNHDGFGGIVQTRPALLALAREHPEALKWETSGYDHTPALVKPLNALALGPQGPPLVVDLRDFITDREDKNLEFALNGVSGDEVVDVRLEGAILILSPRNGDLGVATVPLVARDSGENELAVWLTVHVVDPDRGDVALLKPAFEEAGSSRVPAYGANDGDDETAWKLPQTTPSSLVIDLGGEFQLARASLGWDTATPPRYRLETSLDAATWTIAAEWTADSDPDSDLTVNRARYVRLSILERGTEADPALRRFELEGVRVP